MRTKQRPTWLTIYRFSWEYDLPTCVFGHLNCKQLAFQFSYLNSKLFSSHNGRRHKPSNKEMGEAAAMATDAAVRQNATRAKKRDSLVVGEGSIAAAENAVDTCSRSRHLYGCAQHK